MTEQTADFVLEDGIYFDMPEDQYHALHRLSSSGMQDIMISPANFWARSWMNPDRQEKSEEQTAAQRFGKAYHSAILEPELFATSYCREITKEDMPGSIKCASDSDIKDALKDMGQSQTKKGETVMDRAQRLRDAGYAFPIWHLFEKQWREAIGDRTVLKGYEWDRVTADQKLLQGIPELAALFDEGAAEVSVLYTCERGIKRKARLDFLRPDGVVDLKTYANSMGKHFKNHLRDAFQYNRYYMQWAHYWDVFELIRAGKVAIVGDRRPEHEQLVQDIQISDVPGVVTYLFQEKGGIPNMFAVTPRIYQDRLTRQGGELFYGDAMITPESPLEAAHSHLYNKAAHDMNLASKLFADHMEMYGDDGSPWYPFTPVIELTDADFNPYFLDAQE